jgi:osmotically-inducible protein OsmY
MRISRRSLFTLFAVLVITIAVRSQILNSTTDSTVSTLNDDFATDPRLHGVRVEISDGYFRLRGTVELLEDQRQAIKKVHARGSSTGVITQLVVITPTVPDASLRLQLTEKIARLELNLIRLRVRRGIVRISGNIPEERQRENVLSVICSTPGVKGIDDVLHVEMPVNAPPEKNLH